MKYEINFDAVTANDEIVANLTMKIEPFDTKCNKPLTLQRFCVEYARLMGFKCSFAKIHYIFQCGGDLINVGDIASALKLLDVTGKITLRYTSSDRIAVDVDDEYFGVWDVERKTFVD